jgi:hypothetical protein
MKIIFNPGKFAIQSLKIIFARLGVRKILPPVEIGFLPFGA